MAEKMILKSSNVIGENIDFIAKRFPNAITEIVENGKPVRRVDFDVLRQELSDSLVDTKRERYQLTWPNKREAIHLANSRTSKTLRPKLERSLDFNETKNVFIEGDNLDALKIMREAYLDRVKVIYIDPPYNTGSDFVYRDDFASDAGAYAEKSGQLDQAGNRLVTNLESNGRFHTDWLNLIYPRLKIARDLLSPDGVIFISIDDHEQSNLRKIADEIFGAQTLSHRLYGKGHTRQLI